VRKSYQVTKVWQNATHSLG